MGSKPSEPEEPQTQRSVSTDMEYQDWVDVAESEFVDIATGEMTDKIGFVFEHPELGLHGFEWHPDQYHIRAVSYSQMGDGDE